VQLRNLLRGHCAAVTSALVLDVCIFACFKVHCKVMPQRNFANFKLVMSRRKDWAGPEAMDYLAYA